MLFLTLILTHLHRQTFFAILDTRINLALENYIRLNVLLLEIAEHLVDFQIEVIKHAWCTSAYIIVPKIFVD